MPDASIDDVLGGLDLTAPEASFGDGAFDPGFEEFHEGMVNDGSPNLIGYALDRIDSDGGQARLHCKYGTFKAAQATSFTLIPELFHQLTLSSGSVTLEDLPARRRIHRMVKDPIISGDGRCAEVAVSVLTIVEGERPEILLFRRSAQVATDPLRLHVAPAGKFQRTGELPATLQDEQFSLQMTILREFAEELLGVPETEGNETYTARTARAVPEVADLYRLCDSGEISLYRTGLVVCLADLQPEITCLAIVRDRSWLNERLKPNWEFLPLHQLPSRDRRRMRIALDDDLELMNEARSSLRPSQLVSRAAAALALGLPAYRQIRERGH